MRLPSILAIAVTAACVLGSTTADAASRHRHRYYAYRAPLIVEVPPERSFLDPGPAPPVGSLSNYVYVSQYPLSMPYSNISHFGRPPLPDRPVPLIEGVDFGPLSGP